jgi:hypothetical protein
MHQVTEKQKKRDVSEVGDGFAFSSERFAPLLVPNVNHCVPDAGRRVLSDGIFSL